MPQTSLSLPANILLELEQWGKTTNTLFERLRSESGVIPPNTPADQKWFWSKKWQKDEQHAENEIATGQVDVFNNVEELLADLDA